jgi:cell division initiation protein
MALTPADIEKKTFSTALRGYDLDEVDDFLDEMVGALREKEEELTQAQSRIADLERGGAVAAAPLAPPPPAADETAVGRALVAAQHAADRLLDDAKKDADKIVEEARSEAETFTKERDVRKAEVDAEMAEMTDRVTGIRTQLAALATSVADKLDEMDSAIGISDEDPEAEPESLEVDLIAAEPETIDVDEATTEELSEDAESAADDVADEVEEAIDLDDGAADTVEEAAADEAGESDDVPLT